MKLVADPIEETTNMEAEQCLGVCLHNSECKAFNVYPRNSTTPIRCHFFASNKCSAGAELIPSEEVNYFDTVGDKKCKNGKS